MQFAILVLMVGAPFAQAVVCKEAFHELKELAGEPRQPPDIPGQPEFGAAKNSTAQRELTERLNKQILYHSFRYHILNDPLISKAEYEGLVRTSPKGR